MIDLEKLVNVVLGAIVLLAFVVVATQSYALGQQHAEPIICPEPIPVVCMVKATHPATDGGEMLTVHCPPEEA